MPGSNRLIVLLGVLVAVAPVSIDTYTLSLPAIAQALGTSPGTIALTLSAFFFGLACGGIFWRPLSARFGRRSIFISGLVLFFVHYKQGQSSCGALA